MATDGSLLGDLCDENSPRHKSAELMFVEGWLRLPNHEYPPDVKLHRGDMCKVSNQVWVWNGREWDKSYAWEPCS